MYPSRSQIKEKALTEVFAKEMENMDDESKEVLEKAIQHGKEIYQWAYEACEEIAKKG